MDRQTLTRPGVTIMQGDALALDLPDDSVDLVVTSPPYLNLRAYQDGGKTYEGQIGNEPTPVEFIDSLVDATREMVRVLKPSGNLWINLGDSYSGGQRLDNEFTAQDAAWLAGVIDSDGSVSVRVDNNGRSHITWVRVGQMKPEVVERIGKVTGTGKVWQDKRGVWNWSAAAQQAKWVLERIWPYLYIKRRQALAGIELMNRKAAVGAKGRWNPLADDELRRRERIRQAVLAWNRGDQDDYDPPAAPTIDLPQSPRWVPQKSLVGAPWRYALRCIDELGLILRAEVIWSKPNGLPESVTDRVRRSHETWFHFTLNPRYYSAVDEVREAHAHGGHGSTKAERLAAGQQVRGLMNNGAMGSDNRMEGNPLGKLPGSVWTIPTEPLRVPDHLGIDHFAAFPTEWPRRIITGWSPRGVCVQCGEGRRPVVERTITGKSAVPNLPQAVAQGIVNTGGAPAATWGVRAKDIDRRVTGEACDCPEPTAPTTPGVVLDPFGGTGTTALVAHALGRHGISNDMSADYCRLARWRTSDPKQQAKAARRPYTPPAEQVAGQISLLDLEEDA